MYKKMDAAQRCDQLQTLAFQLDVLEGAADEQGPFIAGARAASNHFARGQQVSGRQPGGGWLGSPALLHGCACTASG
jgi:hypothetical protein